ncbi:ribosomal protein L21e-domain-containing protein [Ochromonadaceae sp. CCMP2298]|nr:ribosomal protein L21e-domain-containing protein [Ochromonadaceae sp. CCMP2298]
MPHSFGYRAQTRTLFKKAYKTNGRCSTTTYLRNFKRGDYVDIKVDSSIHKGMPFKYYHGRTGVVFNVNKRAVGVIVNKEVNGRILRKQLHISLPHVKPSTCQKQIIERKKSNEAHKKAVREGTATKANLKRIPKQPKSGYFFGQEEKPETIQPLPYIDLV